MNHAHVLANFQSFVCYFSLECLLLRLPLIYIRCCMCAMIPTCEQNKWDTIWLGNIDSKTGLEMCDNVCLRDPNFSMCMSID
jgi:hypothetical protein